MVIFTETMANLVRELAACAGAVETEVSEETVSIRFCGGPGRLPPKPKDPAAGGKLRGGPDAVRGKSGRKLKTYAFDGETHTVREWAEKYGCTAIGFVIGSSTDTYTKQDDHNLNYSNLNWP